MMSTVRHRPAAPALAAVLAAVLLSAPIGHAQQAPTEEQQQEYVELATIVGAALKGEIVPADEPFGWANDFLKGSDQTTFVPFTLSIDQSKIGTSSAAMYIFVTAQGERVAEAAALPAPAFEDAYHVDLGAPSEGGAYVVRRGFSVPAGSYDIYLALSESGVAEGADARKMMLKKTLSVPDLWSNRLATSTVIMTARVEELSEPLPLDQQLANPYTLGTLRIVPETDLDYLTTDEVAMVFLVYNAGLTPSGMPDVTIDYTFNTRGPSGIEFFRATNPQYFNAQTLPPGFDVAAGHQLLGGQGVPLTPFPAADYRLEIKVTDNTNGASLIHNVDFSVSEF